MAELLRLLRVTKQSLNRVLNDLLRNGFVERKAGMKDRRTRRLQLTSAGKTLADAVWSAQRPLIAAAFRAAGQDAVNGYRKVMIGIAGEPERWRTKP